MENSLGGNLVTVDVFGKCREEHVGSVCCDFDFVLFKGGDAGDSEDGRVRGNSEKEVNDEGLDTNQSEYFDTY